MAPFNITATKLRCLTTKSKKFNATQQVCFYRLTFDKPSSVEFTEVVQAVSQLIVKLLNDTLPATIRPEDRVRVCIANEELNINVNLPFVRFDELDTEEILNTIQKFAQSRRDFFLNGDIVVDIIHVEMPNGGGFRSKTRLLDYTNYKSKSNKVVQIKGDGNCLARAIVVAKAKVDGLKGLPWEYLVQDRKKRQTDAAMDLSLKAGVKFSGKETATYEDLQCFGEALKPDHQLIVVSAQSPKTIIFKTTKNGEFNHQVFIIQNGNHYDALLSIRSYMQCDHWCPTCLKGYSAKSKHHCSGTCPACFGSPPCRKISPMLCEDCQRNFFNLDCFTNHKKQKICNEVKRCKECRKVHRGKEHICNGYKCKTCKLPAIYGGHSCFIEPIDLSSLKAAEAEPSIFVFYDLEAASMQTSTTQKLHVIDLCIAKTICDNCWNDESKIHTDGCSYCGSLKGIFRTMTAVDEFCSWLLNNVMASMKQRHDRFTIYCIAHNAKGYDSQFIQRKLLETRRIPKVIKHGTKILCMTLGPLKFIDSHSFLPMALSKFGKSFGLLQEKDRFPHDFHTIENMNYEGPWPDLRYYQPQKYSGKELTDLVQWYETKRNLQFNMKHELEYYCDKDVEVLLQGVMSFRALFKHVAQIDPLRHAISISGAVMKVFRAKYLSPKTIGIPPAQGYNSKRKQSYAANCWLDYTEQERKISIKREVKIGKFYADGLFANEVFEFFGCIFHGCKRCFPSDREATVNPLNGKSMNSLYADTEIKLDFYKKSSYHINVIWECEWTNMVKKSKDIEVFVQEHGRHRHKIMPCLEPRHAYFGGRTNASTLLHNCKEGEKIHYFDFRSLYPDRTKRGVYPVGHPEVSYDDTTDISNIFGLVYCKVRPPRRLFFPILPARVNGKLVFTLCHRCSATGRKQCYHNDEDRALVGTWVSLELQKAIECGYQIMEVYEVWKYTEKKQLSDTNHGLFDELINLGLKLKFEAAGWPRNDMADVEKEAYLDFIEQHEGIKLDRDSIRKSPGMYLLAKLFVNSFYGKFGEKSKRMKVEYTSEPEKLFSLLANNEVLVNDLTLLTDEMIEIDYEPHDEFIHPLPHTSSVIAAFVTAQARLKLYGLLERFGERVLYFDTDSIFLLAGEGSDLPVLGPLVGDLTDELEEYGPGSYITKFVSTGAKSYAYEVCSPEGICHQVCKIKGLVLGFDSTKTTINFDTLEALVTGNLESIMVPQMRIGPKGMDMFTMYFDKRLRRTYDKRVICEDGKHTLPFGY